MHWGYFISLYRLGLRRTLAGALGLFFFSWCVSSLRGCCRCALMTKSHECLQHADVDHVLLTPPPPPCHLLLLPAAHSNRKWKWGATGSCRLEMGLLSLLVLSAVCSLSGCVCFCASFLHVSSCRVVRRRGSDRAP